MKPRVVNLFAGPGVGKSVQAAGLYYKASLRGINAIYIDEHAKRLTHLEEWLALHFQPTVTAEQWMNQSVVAGKYDITITDSPIPIGLVYPGRGCTPTWETWTLELFNESDNLNIFLQRNPDIRYRKTGRQQSPKQAAKVDRRVLKMLNRRDISYETLMVGGEETVHQMLDIIKARWPEI